MPRKRTRKRKRLTREDWLRRGLEVVAEEGFRELNIDRVARQLGVTKGSFYWHFANRKDFVLAVLDYWAELSTGKPIRRSEEIEPDPARRLHLIMLTLERAGLARYDVPIRAWAALDPDVARRVRRVDRERYAFVRRMFSGLGFRGNDLEARTRAFVVFQSMHLGMADRPSRADQIRLIPYYYRLFAGRDVPN